MTKTRSITVVAAAAALTLAGVATAQLQTPRVSPNAAVSQTIGTTEVTINYCRPGVKGRVIWGDLVPFDKVWRTGANEATRFSVDDDVTIDGKPLPAGTYQLATIPGKDEWTVIFNTAANEWGAYSYDPKQDVLRVQVKPHEAPFVERMMFVFDNLTDTSADVVLRWEKLAVPFTVGVDVGSTTLARAEKAVAAAAVDDWQTPYQAASYCFRSDLAIDRANAWLEKSIAIKETPQNLGLKARRLAAAGSFEAAVATAKRAVEMGQAAGANTSALEKLIVEWEGKGK
jgi:hypothetical protein